MSNYNITPVAASIPFDSDSLTLTSTTVQDAIAELSVSSGLIPELSNDPVSPVAGRQWVLAGGYSVIGAPIGMLLTLTVATSVPTTFQLSYKTASGRIVRTNLT